MSDIVIFAGSSWINSDHPDPDGEIYSVLRAVGPYQVASVLRNQGYIVTVIDYFPYLLQHRHDDLLKLVDKLITDTTIWVGFSSTFFEDIGQDFQNNPLKHHKIKNFIEYVKEKNKNIKIILGGAHAWKKERPELVDYYVEGYADESILKLTKYLKGEDPFFMFENKTVSSDRTAVNFDFSNYKFSWADEDCINPNEVLPIEISRGCIFKCSYCSYPLNGKKKLDFIKNPKILYDHFMENYDRFGVTSYMYTDDTHNDSLEKLEHLYNNVYSKLPFKIKFSAYLRLDLLKAHPDMIPLLRESGLSSCFFGIESLNYESNKVVGKGMRLEKTVQTLNKVRTAWPNIFLQGAFIVGLPNETEETANNWLNLVTDPTFPLDRVTLNALSLSKIQGVNGYWYNDIEKFPEKYGYTYSTNQSWTSNTGMTYSKAVEIQRKFGKKIREANLNKKAWVTSWRLQNVGLTYDQFKSLTVLESKNTVNSFIDNYLKLLHTRN